MTVATEIDKSGPYAGAGTTGPFTVGFRFLDNTHLQVIRTNSAGVDTTLAYPADYAVTGVGNPTGTVMTTVAVPAGETLTIIRDVPFTQEADYVQNDDFPAQSHETALDKLTMQTQQLNEGLSRSLTLPPTVPGVSTKLPPPAALNVIGWNEAEDALRNFPPTEIATIVAFGTWRADQFIGDGVQTEFTLTGSPGVIANLDVSIAGVTQRPGSDYSYASGTTLTMAIPVPNGAAMLVRYGNALATQDSILRGEIQMSSYAELRAYPGSMSVQITSPGIAGVFIPIPSDTTSTDDGGYIIVSSNGLRRRRVINGAIDPAWWGAVSDYNPTTKTGTDNYAAFYKAVVLASAGATEEWNTGAAFPEVCATVRPNTGNYKLLSPIPIPTGVIFDANHSLFGGNGFTDADTDVFVTGYIDTADGVLKSNLALGNEVGRVINAQILNWRATNVRKVFNAKNFNEGCKITGGSAYNVQQTYLARRSFYGEFSYTATRGLAGNTPKAAYEFDGFVNIMNLDGLVSTDRGQNMLISGGVNGLNLRNQSYEGGQDGLTFLSEVYPANITGNYFEGLAGSGLNLGDTATKRNVVIDSNWFFQIGQVGIIGNNMQGGRIGSGNYFDPSVAVNIDIDDVYSTTTVEITPSRVADSGSLRPVFPSAKYALGNAIDVKYRVHIFNGASGDTVATQNYAGDRPMDLPYSGRQGFVTNKIAFCDVTRNGGGASPFTINIDSKISFDNYVMYAFRIRVVDVNFDRMVSGHGYGNVVVIDNNTGPALTVVASNFTGYLRLVIGDLNGASFNYEGVLRHI